MNEDIEKAIEALGIEQRITARCHARKQAAEKELQDSLREFQNAVRCEESARSRLTRAIYLDAVGPLPEDA